MDDILNTKIKSILQEKNTKMLPENIKSGINILGISGNLVPLNGETKTITPTTSQQTIIPSQGKNGITEATIEAVTSSIDANITAGNIKKDVTILNVTGTFEGGSGEYNAKFNTAVTASKNSVTLNLVTLPEFDFANLTNASYFFASLPVSEILFKNTQNVQNFSFMLQNCSNLESLPAEINCASAINTGSMFYGCSKLTSIKLVNTASIITTASMFYNCSKLTSVDLGTMSGGITNASSMFYGCSKLTSIPLFDTSHITGGNGSSMFYGCSSLTDVPQFDFSLVTNMNNMFKNCSSLTNASLNNILASCAGATNITSSSFKTLKQIGLSSAQATTCTGLSNWAAAQAAGWVTGY